MSRMPTRRFLCHCTICQGVYHAPFADAMVASARSIEIASENSLDFKRLNGEKSVDRGICRNCDIPTVGFLQIFPGFTLGLVPTARLQDPTGAPRPSMHIFYESRIADVEDDLPKYKTPSESVRACLWPFLAGFVGI
ncbi:GFA family protein [Altererythrobacter sp. JGD-16]|uniref:GFA family protein n=2 Tax=Altererythrobacter lutimaris TaxID=2743979 RepID=A0A850HD67_9SPHN|nr:GFA family protein [Altererythrobacter lutimaris]